MTHGRPDINQVISHLQEKVGGELDDTVALNRRYARLLIDKFRREHPQKDPVESIKSMIEVVYSGHPKFAFHESRAVTLRFFYYNVAAIRNTFRSIAASERPSLTELARRRIGADLRDGDRGADIP